MTAPTPWSRFSMPRVYAPSVTGAPLPGAKLYFFVSGESTPLDTYSDSTLSTPNTNPVVADDAGIFGDIFLQTANYKVRLTDADGVEVWTADPVSPFQPSTTEDANTVVLELTVDGNGGVPGVGVCGDLYCPFACTLTGNVLQAIDAGDLIVDVWANTFVTNSPPSATDSITASDPPTLSASQSSIDTTLTGWSTAIAAGTAIRFNIVSITDITRFTLSLVATRSETTP